MKINTGGDTNLGYPPANLECLNGDCYHDQPYTIMYKANNLYQHTVYMIVHESLASF